MHQGMTYSMQAAPRLKKKKKKKERKKAESDVCELRELPRPHVWRLRANRKPRWAIPLVAPHVFFSCRRQPLFFIGRLYAAPSPSDHAALGIVGVCDP